MLSLALPLALALASAAAPDPLCSDPALAPLLCLERPSAPLDLRAELLAADTTAAVAALIPRLAAAPDLQGIARLVALDRPGSPQPEHLADPVSAQLSPIGDAALSQALLALRLRYTSDAPYDRRAQATALLARIHGEAYEQLGLADAGPLPPFARLLAGRALYYQRELSTMYWQRRVAGLEGLVRASELRLFRALLAVERSPHHGDDALLASERHRSRRYVLRGGPRQRIDAALAASAGPPPADLDPIDPIDHLAAERELSFPDELDRLIDHGSYDLALERTIGEASALGLDLAESLLLGALEAHQLPHELARARARLLELRGGEGAPPALGVALPRPRRPPTWPDGHLLAERLAAELSAADDERGALALALAALRDRPDAARALIAAIVPSSPGSAAARRSDLVRYLPALLSRLAADLGDPQLRLPLHLAAARLVASDQRDEQESQRRRAFALAARGR